MIKLQNLPQLALFNSGAVSKTQNRMALNNNLERSPQYDSVSFSGKFEEPEEDQVFEVDSDDVFVVPEEDILDVPEAQDVTYLYDIDDQERRLRESEETENRRRRQEEEDIMNNDIIMYGAVYPLLLDDVNSGVEPEPISFDDDMSGTFDSNDGYSPFEDDITSLDDGFNDFGF